MDKLSSESLCTKEVEGVKKWKPEGVFLRKVDDSGFIEKICLGSNLHSKTVRVTVEVEAEPMTEQRAINICAAWQESSTSYNQSREICRSNTGQWFYQIRGYDYHYFVSRIELAEALLVAYPELESVE